MELSADFARLRDFYYEARTAPADQDFVRAERLVLPAGIFTLDELKRHLNNPMLTPAYFSLWHRGERVNLAPAVAHKVIQKNEVPFLNKQIIQDYLSRGASVILEGLDILDPRINAMCAAIDAPHDCVSSNSVVFFSQRGNELYRGHLDTDDVLVVHLGGRKKWRVHRRQPPRRTDMFNLPPARMGELQAEFVMEPGDALFLRSGTPHIVETVADYSLHMSFDICDRNVNAETSLQLLLEHYDTDSAPCYAPTTAVVDKLVAHAGSEAFKRRLAEHQATQREIGRRARDLLGTNSVTYLDKLIAADAAKTPR